MNEVSVQIESLHGMSPAALRDLYREVFGEPSRSNNKQWLVRRIAWRMQAQAEGGLSDRAKARAEELARDADIRSRPPGDFRCRGPALGAALRTVTGEIVPRKDARIPMVGTVLTREYLGKTHRVRVLTNGFEHDGQVYRSLSAIAKVISGSHWNGFSFFGLDKPDPKGVARGR